MNAPSAGGSTAPPARHRNLRRWKQRGVEMIEFTLVMLPMLGFIFLLLDLGWAVYKRATLQFAVREGCRYAVTNQTQNLKDASNKVYGEIDSIKWVVQQRANGLLGWKATDPGYALIQVNYYDPTSSLSTALTLPTTCANNTGTPPNWADNIVEVSIVGFQASPLAPLLRSNSPLVFTARSSDRMEGNPPGGVPLLFNGTCP